MYWFLISSWRLLCVSVPRSALKDRGRTELLVMPLKLFCVLHSLLLLSDQRVCTLRGLALCVLPSTVNSGMIRHWYRVRQVRGDQFGPATEIKCQRKRNEIMACATLAVWVSMCVSLLVFDPHYCTYALFSECFILRHTLCTRNQNNNNNNKTYTNSLVVDQVCWHRTLLTFLPEATTQALIASVLCGNHQVVWNDNHFVAIESKSRCHTSAHQCRNVLA